MFCLYLALMQYINSSNYGRDPRVRAKHKQADLWVEKRYIPAVIKPG